MEPSALMSNVIDNPVPKHSLICNICQLQVDETNIFVKCQYCEILLHISCISSCNNSEKKYFISANEWSCNECFHLNIIDDINNVSTDDIDASSYNAEVDGIADDMDTSLCNAIEGTSDGIDASSHNVDGEGITDDIDDTLCKVEEGNSDGTDVSSYKVEGEGSADDIGASSCNVEKGTSDDIDVSSYKGEGEGIIDDIDSSSYNVEGEGSAVDIDAASYNVERKGSTDDINAENEGSSELLKENNSGNILADLEYNENHCLLGEKSIDFVDENFSLAQHNGTTSTDIENLSESNCGFVENKKTKIRYVSLLNGTKNGKPKVYDSFGHGFCLFTMIQNCIKWNCIKRNGRDNCRVYLKQIDGNFEQINTHNHGAHAEDYINALIKKSIEQSPVVLTLSIIKNNKISTPNSFNVRKMEVVGPHENKSLANIINKSKSSSKSKSVYNVILSDKENEEPILADHTLGFTYRLLKSTGHLKTWICSSPGTHNKCKASVKQHGDHFIRMRGKHFHGAKKRKIVGMEKNVSCSKTTMKNTKMKIKQSKYLVSKKLLKVSGVKKGQKIRASQRIHQSLKKSSISLGRASKAQQVDKGISKENKLYDGTVKEKMSTRLSSSRFALNKNIIPIKPRWNGKKKNSFSEVGSVIEESKIMELKLDNERKINHDPLSEEHNLAITKIFLDIMNTGYPVNLHIKLNASNLKNNKLFKIFMDGCKYYFDKQNLNIFPKSANKPPPLWIMQFLQNSTLLSQRIIDLATKSYSATSWSKLSWFYSNFERSMRETCRLDPCHYLDTNNAHRIFNCDLLVLTINLTNFDEKVHKLSQKTMTVICCASSTGQSIKPLIINRGKSVAKYACDNEIDSKYNSISSLNGKVDSQIFHEWLILFDNQLVELGVRRPVILFLSGIHTYISYKSIQFAANKNIIFYHIPPISSGTLSPLSACVFPVLKDHFYKKFKKVMIRNKFPIAFIKAYLDTNVAELAVEGFKDTGLCPYNETALNDKFTEKDIPTVEHKNLCPPKESVLSLLGKRKNSIKTNNNFALNIQQGVSQLDTDLDKLQENLLANGDNKLISKESFESNDYGRIKDLNITNTKLSELPDTISSNGSPLLSKKYSRVDVTNELQKIKTGKFLDLVKSSISMLPNDHVFLENKNNLSQQDNISDDSVMIGKSHNIVSHCQNMELSSELFTVNNVDQILSNSGKIGYQIAIENMEEVFKNIIDPEILSLYERKLALDEDYPDTTYLVWCGLQHLKKIISSQSNS